MTTYTDVFGSETVPPAEQSYRAVTLTADVSLGFASTTDGINIVAGIMDVTASSGPFSITLPNATSGSKGEETLMRNIGANSFLVKDYGGNTLATVAAGESKFFYLTDNSTSTGAWRVITYGTGTSTADASALAGNGLTVVGSELALGTEINTTASNTNLDAIADRSEVYVFTGGSVTCNLPTVVSAGQGWYVDLGNKGTGSVTVDNTDGALIDGASSFTLAPTESARFYTDGVAWYSIGYGRSASFVFTKLVKDISTGSPFTLSSAECSNKLFQFIGTSAANVTVNVPPVVSIYYVQCAFSGAYTLTLKTSSGTGVALANNARSILYCDGTNVVDAQTVAASTILAMLDGTAAIPSLYFSSDTDTGIYRAGTNSFGIAAGGVQGAVITSTGINDTPIGATTRAAGSFTTATLTNPLAATSGGTSYSSYAVGDILYANATTTLAKLADVATGNALISGGVNTAPSWGKIALTTHVSGILPVANGGTGIAYFGVSGPTTARTYAFPDASTTVLTTNSAVTAVQGGTGQTSYAVGDLLYASTTTALSKLAAGTSGFFLKSNGAGVAPSWASASGSGSITASGYTQNTAKLLGRTTASSGAIEEISVSSDFSLSSGTLSLAISSGFANFAVITASGTWTAPAGVTKIRVTVVGGGGNSGAPGGNGCGQGGAGGGWAIKTYTGITPGNNYTVTVGAAAGTTSFAGPGVTVQATGGASGVNQTSSITTPGVGSNGDINGSGQHGGYGGSGTGGTLDMSQSAGGGSYFAQRIPGTVGGSVAGRAATDYGGGAAGAVAGVGGGSAAAGFQGVIIVEY